MTSTDAGLDGSPYQQYLYAYPHKTSYRALRPRPSLAQEYKLPKVDSPGLVNADDPSAK